jgi:hypothetical protein
MKPKGQKMVKTSVIDKKLTQSRAATAVPMPTAGKRYSKQQALAIAKAHPKLVKVSQDMMDGECYQVAGAGSDEEAAMYGFTSVAAWCDDHDFYSCENDMLDACYWEEAKDEATCVEVAGAATSADAAMFGFTTVADWCADHDVFSCENDMLEACTWGVANATAAAATTATAAADDYYAYDSYDDYYYDDYAYDSYSYDSYSYDSYSYGYSETVAGFDLDLGSHGVWCDFVVESDGYDEMYNLECQPWEEYDPYYDPYYGSDSYGSDSYYSSSYPEGTVLCPGNDSGAYCDL